MSKICYRCRNNLEYVTSLKGELQTIKCNYCRYEIPMKIIDIPINYNVEVQQPENIINNTHEKRLDNLKKNFDYVEKRIDNLVENFDYLEKKIDNFEYDNIEKRVENFVEIEKRIDNFEYDIYENLENVENLCDKLDKKIHIIRTICQKIEGRLGVLEKDFALSLPQFIEKDWIKEIIPTNEST